MSSILTRLDYEDFLIHVYFGPPANHPLKAYWRRAYRDFNRTLHGISDDVHQKAEEALNHVLLSVKEMAAPTQAQFDSWHRDACATLAATCRECGYPSFFVGQAQKWLNMTFKYIYVMGEKRLTGFQHLYGLCHVPLDNILMDALKEYGFEPLPCAWSRLNDYDVYLDRQRWVRNRFPLVPLDTEFQLWMHRPLPVTQ